MNENKLIDSHSGMMAGLMQSQLQCPGCETMTFEIKNTTLPTIQQFSRDDSDW